VGNANRGAAFHQLLQSGLNDFFGFGIQRVGGFIETKIGAFLKMALAMAIRWRWPPEMFTPFSPPVFRTSSLLDYELMA